jgi:hypothetical protein
MRGDPMTMRSCRFDLFLDSARGNQDSHANSSTYREHLLPSMLTEKREWEQP